MQSNIEQASALSGVTGAGVPDFAALNAKEPNSSSSKEPISINLNLDGRLIHQSVVDRDQAQQVRSYAY
jgi:hypothetical protein